MDYIQFGDPPQNEDGNLFSFEPANTPYVNADVANARAEKYHFGLGDISPGFDTLFNSMMVGTEDDEKKAAIAKQQANDTTIRQQALQDYVTQPRATVTKDDADLVPYLGQAVKGATIDPDVFFEKQYANRLINTAVTLPDQFQSKVAKAIEINDQYAYDKMDHAERIITIKEGAQKVLEDLETEFEGLSTTTRVADKIGSFIPFVEFASQRNELPGAGASSWFKGQNLEAYRQFIYGQDNPGDAVRLIRETAKKIAAHNYQAGIEFVKSMVTFAASDKNMGNLSSVLDIASIPLPELKAIKAFTGGLAGIVKAATVGRRADLQGFVEATGDLAQAAHVGALKSLQERATRTSNPETWDKVTENIKTISNPSAIFEGPIRATISNEGKNRLINGATALLRGTIDDTIRIARIDGEKTFTTALDEAKNMAQWQYPDIADAVLDVKPISNADPLANINVASIKVGKKTQPIKAKLENAKLDITENFSAGMADNSQPRGLRDLPVEPLRGGSVMVKEVEAQLKNANDNAAILLGQKDATLFDTEEAAIRAAKEDYKIGAKDYTVRQQGMGYYIEIQRPMVEVSPGYREALAIETKNATPSRAKDMLISLGGNVGRTPEDTLAKGMNTDRHLAVYGAPRLMNIIRGRFKDIEKVKDPAFLGESATIGSKPLSRQNLVKYLERQRVQKNPETGERGVFDTSQVGFENNWEKMHGRLPTEKESLGYWAYVQVNDLDYALRNLGILRDKHRLGLQDFSFPFLGGKFKRPAVEGKLLTEFPHDIKKDAGILVWDKDPANFAYKRKTFMKKGEIDQLIKDGYKPIQLTYNGEDALRAAIPNAEEVLPKGRIHFVFAKDYESAPQQWLQIPYKPGGHHDYIAGTFLKQPKVRVGERDSTYYGDISLRHFENDAEAKMFNERYNKAREILADTLTKKLKKKEKRDFTTLDGYLQRNLPDSVESFLKMFKQTHSEGVFDVNTPFHAVPKGQTVDDVAKLADKYKNLSTAKDDPWNLYKNQVNLSYATERGDPLMTIINKGDELNPVYNFKPAKMIDPVVTMERAVGDLLKQVHVADLKFKAAEQFIGEFSGIMKPSLAEMRNDPIAHLMNPQFKGKVDRQTLNAAQTFRNATVDFLGLKTEGEKTANWLQQKAADSILGQGAVKIAPNWMLRAVKDPIHYMKSVAFTTKMGMGNPVQLFTQLQTVSNVIALEGVQNGLESFMGSMIMRSLTWTDRPDIIEHAAKMATAFGWNKQEFKEAYASIQRTGFHRAGRERAYLDDYQNANMIQGKFDKALSIGQSFVNWGEELTRATAWNAAYRNWRKANPSAVFDEKAIAANLDRADLLNVNMSAASNAPWQKNKLLSVPTQFWGYQVRLAEQMLGKRLTPLEKAKMMLTHSALYGVPVASGAWVGLWPVYKSVINYFYEKGWNQDIDDNAALRVVHDGAVSAALQWVSGEKYNFGERFGPGGLDFFHDLWNGDYGRALSGAGGTTLAGFLKDGMNPIYGLAMTAVTGDKDSAFAPNGRDVLDFFRNISSVNTGARVYDVAHLGKYITKGTTQLDVSLNGGWDVAMQAMGMQPQRMSDMFKKSDSNQALDAHIKSVRKDIVKWLRLGYEAVDGERWDEARMYFKRANLDTQRSGMNPIEMQQTLTESFRGNQSIINRIGEKFARTPERRDAWIKELYKRENR